MYRHTLGAMAPRVSTLLSTLWSSPAACDVRPRLDEARERPALRERPPHSRPAGPPRGPYEEGAQPYGPPPLYVSDALSLPEEGAWQAR
jgi:hypothetical protein